MVSVLRTKSAQVQCEYHFNIKIYAWPLVTCRIDYIQVCLRHLSALQWKISRTLHLGASFSHVSLPLMGLVCFHSQCIYHHFDICWPFLVPIWLKYFFNLHEASKRRGRGLSIEKQIQNAAAAKQSLLLTGRQANSGHDGKKARQHLKSGEWL